MVRGACNDLAGRALDSVRLLTAGRPCLAEAGGLPTVRARARALRRSNNLRSIFAQFQDREVFRGKKKPAVHKYGALSSGARRRQAAVLAEARMCHGPLRARSRARGGPTCAPRLVRQSTRSR